MEPSATTATVIPGELSWRRIILAVLLFFMMDLLAYGLFPKLFSPTNPPKSTVQPTADKKVESIELQLGLVERERASIEAKIGATGTPNPPTVPADKNGALRGELDKLKSEIHRLQKTCCQQPQACKQ